MLQRVTTFLHDIQSVNIKKLVQIILYNFLLLLLTFPQMGDIALRNMSITFKFDQISVQILFN